MSDVPTIDLRGAISVKMNPAFRRLVKDEHRKQILVGGASSSKSYSTAQKLVYKCLAEPGHKILVVRKVARTLRHSTWDLMLDIIKRWHVEPLFRYNGSEMIMRCAVNGNEIIFTGLDDVEKLKSIHGITDIWVEEASEISEPDFNQLDLRLRGETAHKKQITLTMNPISALHWVKRRFFDRVEDDTITHRSTYKDNEHLDADTIRNLEAITDPYFRKVYVEGEWGVYGNVVFSDYVIEEFDYGEDDLENVSTGMDFGFAHASAIERVGMKDGELYVFDELYGKGWTNSDLMAYAKEQWPDSESWTITADSAEPDRLVEWERAGYRNVAAAKKGPGSLKYGIDWLCSKRLHVHATKCQHLAREITMFKRREDKDGNALDAFVEVNDDTIAALRYATEWIWANADQYAIIPDTYTADDMGF